MLLTILLVIVIIVAALLGLAATRPNTFRVERNATLPAAPDAIYPLIVDLHQWENWSPYEKKDPTMQRSFSGAASGKGAGYAWEGNSKVGAGRMEIIDAVPPGKVVIQLDFLRPMQARNTAEFTLLPLGDATQVTWAMYGPTNFMSKLMGVVINMDKMIGADFEVGLQNLQRVVAR